MKKIGAILIISLIIFSFLVSVIVLAQDESLPPGLPTQMQDPEEAIQQAKNKSLSTWDYINREFKNIILKNKVVSAVDSFLTKISIVFKILLGMPYSLSVTFFAVILLWIFFMFEFGRWIQSAFGISDMAGLLIGAGISIVLAQLKILLWLVEIIGWLLFAKKAWWWTLIMATLVILTFVLIYYLSKILDKWLVERRKKKKQKKGEHEIEKIEKFSKGFTEGAGI